MKTLILKENFLESAKNILTNDGVVAFPTDTVYGLCCNAFSEKGIKEIYSVKGRDFSKALIVMIPTGYNIENVVNNVTENAKKFMDKFWPGALTIIFQSKNCLPKIATGGLNTVGVRIPDCKISIDLLNYVNLPLCTTSANISGMASPVSADEVCEYFNGKIPLIIDGGICDKGVPSTIVDLSGNDMKILRIGSVSEKELLDTIKN